MMNSHVAQTAPHVKMVAAANPFDLLPREIVTKILGLDERYHLDKYPLLRSAEDLRRLRATCKLFCSLVSEAGVLRWFFKEDGSVTRFNTFTSSKFAASLKRIWLQVQPDYSFDLASLLPSALLPAAETLESVTLILNEGDSDSGVLPNSRVSLDVFRSCKKLRHILIRPWNPKSSWRLADALKSPLCTLAKLSLSSLNIQPPELQAMLLQIPGLESLNVILRRPGTSMNGDFVIISRALKSLRWIDDGSITRLGITCPCLKELSITTEALLSISCPCMETLFAHTLRKVNVIATMNFLGDLYFFEADSSTVFKILEAAPQAKDMSIWRWHPETLQPLQTIGRLCRKLKLLQLDFETWTSICSAVNSHLKQETRTVGVAFCSFPKLQRVNVFLGNSKQDPSTRESITRLRILTASCHNLRRMDLVVMLEGDCKDEIEIGLRTVSRENPSCLFVLRDSNNKSILTVKAERVTHFS